MAKKKIYAVRKGHKTGLFETWAECQKATSGYSGAEFRYAFGCVILTPAGEEFRKSGSGCDPEGVKIRNVAGEMLGAMNAVQWAKEHEYPAVEIRYDYEGVEKWVTGVWRAKTPLTSKYAAHMQEAAEQIKISFCKVAAHTGNHYNEEADQLAKSALLRTDENVSI